MRCEQHVQPATPSLSIHTRWHEYASDAHSSVEAGSHTNMHSIDFLFSEVTAKLYVASGTLLNSRSPNDQHTSDLRRKSSSAAEQRDERAAFQLTLHPVRSFIGLDR